MKTRQSGFTMIELVVVIVILGILAAVAIPRFINLSEDAERAAVAGVAGAIGSAMTLNYAGCAVSNNVVVPNKCAAVANCTDVTNILQGGLPTGYAITPAPLTVKGAPITCTVSKTGTLDPAKTAPVGPFSATFTGIGT